MSVNFIYIYPPETYFHFILRDLALGAVYYRSAINFFGGWIHHPLYIVVVELFIRRSWAHIFCLCAAIMEVRLLLLLFQSDRQNVHSQNQGARSPSRIYDITPRFQKRYHFCRSLLSHPRPIQHLPWRFILSLRQ